jgi:hypothetical protein
METFKAEQPIRPFPASSVSFPQVRFHRQIIIAPDEIQGPALMGCEHSFQDHEILRSWFNSVFT